MPVLENARQEKYVQNLIKGMRQRQAYKDAFPDNHASDKTIDEMASKLFNDDKVHTRYLELLKELENATIMSVKERMEWLTQVVKDEIKEKKVIFKTDEKGNTEQIEKEVPSKLKTKIVALDTLNKMDNAYQQNINVNGNIGRIRIINNLEDE